MKAEWRRKKKGSLNRTHWLRKAQVLISLESPVAWAAIAAIKTPTSPTLQWPNLLSGSSAGMRDVVVCATLGNLKSVYYFFKKSHWFKCAKLCKKKKKSMADHIKVLPEIISSENIINKYNHNQIRMFSSMHWGSDNSPNCSLFNTFQNFHIFLQLQKISRH